MQRIPEPELMDDEEQAKAYDEADFSASHSARVALFTDRFNGASLRGPVLDIGCGSGDVLQRFATAFPDASFVGIDGSAAMVKLGRKRMEKTGLADRVRLIQTFVPSNDIPNADYPVIMSHSFLHHLHEPGVLWRTIKQHAGKDSFIGSGANSECASAVGDNSRDDRWDEGTGSF